MHYSISPDAHEPPLLDLKGPELILGGVRLEDLVIVTEDGYENLNHLRQSLDWN